MDSKHGQIGQSRRGNREKKISECETSCQPPLHINQFVQLLTGIENHREPGSGEGGGGGVGGGVDGGQCSSEVVSENLARLEVITGQDVTAGRTVWHGCIQCPIDGFVGSDQIVLIREINLSSSSPGSCLLQQPDGGFQLSREHQLYYEVQVALRVSGRRSCYFVISNSRHFHYQVVARDLHLWSTVINPTLNTGTV